MLATKSSKKEVIGTVEGVSEMSVISSVFSVVKNLYKVPSYYMLPDNKNPAEISGTTSRVP